MKNSLWLFVLLLGMVACTSENSSEIQAPTGETRFSMMSASTTGIDFVNQLDFNKDFNIYTYRNFYNGGGVAIGDLNKDGLPDIYLTANMKANKLYLNKGDFQFEDVTEAAGVGGTRAWSTGVSLADVNADGWLDIYVCNSGDIAGDNKQNELFINNGDGTFTDQAEAYGLADQGFSTHAAFFDYDKDGDLDVYLLNNSYQAIGSFNLRKNERPKRDPVGGDKLYRNDGGKFVDVSEDAGIYGSVIGFGLGVTVGDIDRDGWLDIYVCNDFFERDYIYMNNGDGTFREDLTQQMRSISAASMGADMVDINFDGYPEVFVTEMLPEPDDRLKTTMTFENWDKYQYNLENGYYHQFTRNMLHLNNADGTFSEIGRLVDIEATDWSWGALIADFDNDGYRDLFISNGINRDILNQDYLNFIANEEVAKSLITEDGVDYKKLIDIIPSNRIPNYLFAGGADLSFSKKTKEWGLDTPSHSNGSAYGDLDNDGDLDLVVNNVDMEAFVYRNETNVQNPNHHYLRVQLKGEGDNKFALGSSVTLKAGGKTYYSELIPTRGFQSSVDYRLHFGLNGVERVDTLIVNWYNDRVSMVNGVEVDQEINLAIENAELEEMPLVEKVNDQPAVFIDVTAAQSIPYTHKENRYADFDRDRLLYHMRSTEGPCLCKGDVNGDGLEDVYAGGAKDQPGQLLVQTRGLRFSAIVGSTLEEDAASEDVDCRFFDADGDGDLDLYVVSGGNEFSATAVALGDRLYFNNGKGSFTKGEQPLPVAQRFENTSCVESADFDGDGDIDLFVGTRLLPLRYGVPVNGYLLENDGSGQFQNVNKTKAPELEKIGMITDAVWSDYDGDQDADLIVVGEWMAITVFQNDGGQLKKVDAGLDQTSGWWNTIETADLDGDGDSDFIVGNHGLNSRFQASVEKPVSCYVNDFDQNRTVEQIVCTFNGDKAYPLVLRHDLVNQMPHLKKEILKYESYQGKTIDELFAPEVLERSVVHQVVQLASVALINEGDGTFKVVELPRQAQYAPIYAIAIDDFTGNGALDAMMGGNLYGVKPEVGRYDASYGVLLEGQGDGTFKALTAKESGIRIDGQVRAITRIASRVLIARNNAEIMVLQRTNRSRRIQ